MLFNNPMNNQLIEYKKLIKREIYKKRKLKNRAEISYIFRMIMNKP